MRDKQTTNSTEVRTMPPDWKPVRHFLGNGTEIEGGDWEIMQRLDKIIDLLEKLNANR